MNTIRFGVLLAICVLLGACRSQLGECGTDDISTLPIVFEKLDDGRLAPVYAGQALTLQYCTSCHSGEAGAGSRGSAPAGFNFDLQTLHDACADPGSNDCRVAQNRLRTADAVMFDYRQLSWNEVDQGRMPPRGTVDEDIERFYQDIDADGNPIDLLPSLEDPASRNLLRQWMACGGPVIGPVIGLDGPVADNPPGTTCRNGEGEDVYGICGVGAPSATPLEPTWASVFNYLSSTCASARCHGGEESPTMLDIDETYAALVGEASAEATCSASPLVAPGSSATSLLMIKLDARADDTEVCAGDPMPPNGSAASLAVRNNIRAWIDDANAAR